MSEPKAPVRVEATGAGRFQMRVTTGGQTFLADEPVSVGGLGSGPDPYSLMSAALGACTAMTLRLYADRKGWPLAHVAVEISHARDAGKVPPDRFVRYITLTGDLDAVQRARMLEIADLCPVHNTLMAGARFETIEVPPTDCDPAAHMGEMERACED